MLGFPAPYRKVAIRARIVEALRSAVFAIRVSLAVGLVIGLGACGRVADGMSGVFGPREEDVIEVSPDAFAPRVFCPSIELDPGRFIIRSFRGRDDLDPSALVYQIVAEKSARQCIRDGDWVRLKIGVAGSVTPGPQWSGGEIVVPVRLRVRPISTTSEPTPEPIFDEVFRVPVSLPAGAPSEDWILVEESIRVPANTNLKLIYGLDDGVNRG